MTVTKIFPFGGSAPRIEQDDLDRDIVGGKGLGLVSFVCGHIFSRWDNMRAGIIGSDFGIISLPFGSFVTNRASCFSSCILFTSHPTASHGQHRRRCASRYVIIVAAMRSGMSCMSCNMQLQTGKLNHLLFLTCPLCFLLL